MRRSAVAVTVRAMVGAFCALLAVTPASGQQPERWSVLLTRGADTITKERATLTATSVVGDLVDKAGGNRLGWLLDRDATGPRRFTLAVRAATDATNAPTKQRLDVAFTGDSAIGTVVTGTGTPVTRRVATKAGAIPYVNPSMVLTELAARAALRGSSAAGAVREGTAPLFLLNGVTASITAKRLGADSLVITLGSVELRVRTDADGRMLSGTIPSQGIVITRGPWLDDAALEVPTPDYSAPAGAPYTAEEVRVPTARGYALAGTLTKPIGVTGRLAVAVTSTGSGPQDRDEGIPMFGDYRLFRSVADTLGRRGIAVLRLDDRGVGASGGDYASATTADFADDVRSAIGWLRTRPDVDPAKVYVIGHSEGGIIAPMVAATDPALAGIVLLAGTGKRGRAVLEFQLRNLILGDTATPLAKRDSALAAVPRMLDSIAKSSAWMAFFFDHDPLATARRVRTPALVLQGATDQQVTPEQAELLGSALRAGGNRDVTVRVIPKTNHLMVADANGFPGGYTRLPSMAIRREVLGALADWIAAHAAR